MVKQLVSRDNAVVWLFLSTKAWQRERGPLEISKRNATADCFQRGGSCTIVSNLNGGLIVDFTFAHCHFPVRSSLSESHEE